MGYRIKISRLNSQLDITRIFFTFFLFSFIQLANTSKSASKLAEENTRLKEDQGEILGEMQKYKKKMIECDINLATATDLYTILKNKLEEATKEVRFCFFYIPGSDLA